MSEPCEDFHWGSSSGSPVVTTRPFWSVTLLPIWRFLINMLKLSPTSSFCMAAATCRSTHGWSQRWISTMYWNLCGFSSWGAIPCTLQFANCCRCRWTLSLSNRERSSLGMVSLLDSSSGSFLANDASGSPKCFANFGGPYMLIYTSKHCYDDDSKIGELFFWPNHKKKCVKCFLIFSHIGTNIHKSSKKPRNRSTWINLEIWKVCVTFLWWLSDAFKGYWWPTTIGDKKGSQIESPGGWSNHQLWYIYLHFTAKCK